MNSRLVSHNSGQLGVIGIGLVHAFALAAIVYTIGYRSGAQVNPAVTIGLLVAGKLKPTEACMYIVSQIIGAVIAAVVVYAIFGSSMAASVRDCHDIYISICGPSYNYLKELQNCSYGRNCNRS